MQRWKSFEINSTLLTDTGFVLLFCWRRAFLFVGGWFSCLGGWFRDDSRSSVPLRKGCFCVIENI